MNTENVLMIIGGLLSVGLIVTGWYIYRLYKRVGRRCTDCGEVLKRSHKSKITLPYDFYFSTRPIREVISDITYEDIKSFVFKVISYLKNDILLVTPNKAFKQLKKTCIYDVQWWIHGAEMVTFSICPECSEFDGKRNIKLVTISFRSISLFHLWWVRIFDREQFTFDDFELKQVLLRRLRAMYEGKLEECKNPGFKITPENFGIAIHIGDDDPQI